MRSRLVASFLAVVSGPACAGPRSIASPSSDLPPPLVLDTGLEVKSTVVAEMRTGPETHPVAHAYRNGVWFELVIDAPRAPKEDCAFDPGDGGRYRLHLAGLEPSGVVADVVLEPALQLAATSTRDRAPRERRGSAGFVDGPDGTFLVVWSGIEGRGAFAKLGPSRLETARSFPAVDAIVEGIARRANGWAAWGRRRSPGDHCDRLVAYDLADGAGAWSGPDESGGCLDPPRRNRDRCPAPQFDPPSATTPSGTIAVVADERVRTSPERVVWLYRDRAWTRVPITSVHVLKLFAVADRIFAFDSGSGALAELVASPARFERVAIASRRHEPYPPTAHVAPPVGSTIFTWADSPDLARFDLDSNRAGTVPVPPLAGTSSWTPRDGFLRVGQELCRFSGFADQREIYRVVEGGVCVGAQSGTTRLVNQPKFLDAWLRSDAHDVTCDSIDSGGRFLRCWEEIVERPVTGCVVHKIRKAAHARVYQIEVAPSASRRRP